MLYTRKAFTMIEIIFVIVILGILSSVAISKMSVTRDDAELTKGRAQVAAIRNAITLTRSTNMLQAMGSSWPAALDDASATSSDGDALFDGNSTIGKLLDYPLYSKSTNGNWRKVSGKYVFKVMNQDVNFTYTASNGQFDCHPATGTASELCKQLTE